MRAISLHSFGDPDGLEEVDRPDPVAAAGQLLSGCSDPSGNNRTGRTTRGLHPRRGVIDNGTASGVSDPTRAEVHVAIYRSDVGG
ncbi:hypothetical protein GCM10010412_081570 [Nonomuraea recticatena]|uniref:Uncharacterized protein n=1 Tax=Nonomuraea recticatena TaxID=46178 RepID=A0ABN3T332_9ACTN